MAAFHKQSIECFPCSRHVPACDDGWCSEAVMLHEHQTPHLWERAAFLRNFCVCAWQRRAPWASYQIRKIAGCACAGNAGNVFPRRRFQRKPLVSDPDMHHGMCVTHVPWCMSGSLTCGNGENVPGIPGACAPGILRIWQEAHTASSTCDDLEGEEVEAMEWSD